MKHCGRKRFDFLESRNDVEVHNLHMRPAHESHGLLMVQYLLILTISLISYKFAIGWPVSAH